MLINISLAQDAEISPTSYINDENAFRWAFNSDACAVEKSADAMRRFAEDTEQLKKLLASKLTV
jgi:transaldolase